VAFDRLEKNFSHLLQSLEELSATFREGRLLKDGLKVTLAGRPNVGKSSLFNGLLSSDRAIVTEIPGTTRDSLSEVVSLQGIPVLLTDTAGVRVSDDKIENMGVERSRRAMADSDLVVVVLDGSQPLTPEDTRILAEVKETTHLIALNKSDLESFDGQQMRRNGEPSIVEVSAKTGDGLNALRDAIIAPFATRDTHDTGLLITDARHFDLLQRAQSSLRSSHSLLKEHASEELVLVGLHDALRFLGEITGETTPDDILSRIFATFCIGK
ncbi:MAG: GTP-binding protein, partial [Acidobacteria bacterium]|nr:GTP-binding protein [Acidobacteriota bacterium]